VGQRLPDQPILQVRFPEEPGIEDWRASVPQDMTGQGAWYLCVVTAAAAAH
jgi:hypothetical protein